MRMRASASTITPGALILRNAKRLSCRRDCQPSAAVPAVRGSDQLPHAPAARQGDRSRQPASTERPNRGSPLTLAQPVDSLPDVTDYRWNRFASDSPIVAVLLWWFVITLFGWFAWPLLFPLTRGLADRGHGLSRAAGWLLLGWVHWMGVSLGLWRNALGPLSASSAADGPRGSRWRGPASAARWPRFGATTGVSSWDRKPCSPARSCSSSHPPSQPGSVASVERRREVHGIRVSQCHAAQPGLPAVRPVFRRRHDQLLLLWPVPGRPADSPDRHLRRGGVQPRRAVAVRADRRGRLQRRIQHGLGHGQSKAGTAHGAGAVPRSRRGWRAAPAVSRCALRLSSPSCSAT